MDRRGFFGDGRWVFNHVAEIEDKRFVIGIHARQKICEELCSGAILRGGYLFWSVEVRNVRDDAAGLDVVLWRRRSRRRSVFGQGGSRYGLAIHCIWNGGGGFAGKCGELVNGGKFRNAAYNFRVLDSETPRGLGNIYAR